MPACFQLSRKTEPTKPVRFIEIDEEICRELGVPISEVEYYIKWYDFIGIRLATGQSFDDIRKYLRELGLDDPTMVIGNPRYDWACQMAHVVEYLDANYTSDAWHESSSRRG